MIPRPAGQSPRPRSRRQLGRRWGAVLVAGATVLATLAGSAPATAANPVTPGTFTGYGFDQCLAPSQSAMDAWLNSSPFLAVGIYIAGDSRGCRNQPNLTPTWISTQLRKGWRLLPITLGPQASCHPSFPRYGDDRTISPRPGARSRYPRARAQGRYWARTTVREAGRLGIVRRSTLWYDLEGFDLTNRHCRESALAFVSAWTTELHELGYVSGVYSSAGSGIKMLDDARVQRPNAFTLPDRIWIARWDGRPDTRTSYIRNDGWRPGNRMKQYRGGHLETWGGVTINIDSNWLDLGTRPAPAVEHCGGTRVDFRDYPALSPGTTATGQVQALQCLLRTSGDYAGPLNGRYSARTRGAVGRWQQAQGYRAGDTWTRGQWMRLHASGARPVLKRGSTGEAVRRVQRALNARDTGPALRVNGELDARTQAALRDWQGDVGMRRDGIVRSRTWGLLRQGRR